MSFETNTTASRRETASLIGSDKWRALLSTEATSVRLARLNVS